MKVVRQSLLDDKVVLHAGDCLEVLATMPPDSVDGVATDPPYHFASIVERFGKPGSAAPKSNGGTGVFKRAAKGFMGKKWDGGDVAFRPETWAAVLRVMKPGAYLVAFGAPKLVHHMAVAIEAAGFEMRDRFLHLVAADAAVLRFVATLSKPQADAFLRCVDESGFGGELAWIFGSGFNKQGYVKDAAGQRIGDHAGALKPAYEPIILARKPLDGTVAENIARHGVGALHIDGCRVKDGTETGAQPPIYRPNRANAVYGAGMGGGAWANSDGRWPADVIHDASDDVVSAFPGDAARFFYSAKADAVDRLGSNHPTVKPLDLMQWLVRLVCPKGGLVLDPFAGTGTTGEAAWREGMRAVLIERDPEYRSDIVRRMEMALASPQHRRRVHNARRERVPGTDDLPLFGG